MLRGLEAEYPKIHNSQDIVLFISVRKLGTISNFKKVEGKVMSLKSKHLYSDANIAIVILFCPFLTVKERNHSLLSQLLPM